MRRAGAHAWKDWAKNRGKAVVCGFQIFFSPFAQTWFVFYFEGGTLDRVLLGKDTEPLCIQRSNSFSCHLNKDSEERRRGRFYGVGWWGRHASRKSMDSTCPMRALGAWRSNEATVKGNSSICKPEILSIKSLRAKPRNQSFGLSEFARNYWGCSYVLIIKLYICM